MEFADERGQHMGVLQVVVVAITIEIRGHHADEIASILVVIRLAEFQPGYLGDGIRFVGRFERTREQILLLEGLRGQFRIDAGRPEEQQFFHAMLVGRMHGMGGDGKIVIQKLGPEGVVGVNAAHFGSSKDHVVGFFFREKGVDSGLIPQVQFSRCPSDDVRETLRLQGATDGRTYHATMACHIDFVRFFHG
jgi:hypothetical protein